MGVMTLALSAFSIVPMAISFVHREFLSQVVTHMRREFKDDEQNGGEEKQVAFWGVVSNALSNDGQSNLPPKDDEEVVRMTEIMFIFFLVCIGILLVYLVCSILLIFGAAKGKRWLLLPWIILTFLLLLAYLGGTITSIIELGYRFEILLLLGFAIVEVAIGFYLWVCIVSLFQVNYSFSSSPFSDKKIEYNSVFFFLGIGPTGVQKWRRLGTQTSIHNILQFCANPRLI